MQSKIEVFEVGDVMQLRPSAKAKSARERKRVMRAAERTMEDIEMEVAGIIKAKSTRGIITDYSYPARSRSKKTMRETIGIKTTLTITFPDQAFFGKKTDSNRIKHADKIMKVIRQYLWDEYGIAGCIARHLKERKSGCYVDQVLPHFHGLIDQHLSAKKLKAIKVFIVGAMKLPEPWMVKSALKSDSLIQAQAIKNKSHLHAEIGYMCKPLCPYALEKLNGISIGRSFYEFGQPVKETPIQKELSQEAEAFFRRSVRKYIEAKTKRYSVTDKKRMSRALKLHMTDPASGFIVYMDSKDTMRLYDLAINMAMDSPENTKSKMAQAA